ncbi:AsmA protein [Zhongshania antarctica]|uniref:AsmA protein n=1 Tax=Zhongshania antarctica TaxID=641702 RepID=A0A840R3A0_9GAMM|nr:AsmA family protein [Zhongshania antarctica]MBB5186881.1 AsmA protein [Zhongshania antarctica]
MPSALKYTLIGLLSVVILAGSALAALVFLIDPNIFKGEIEKLAADQGLVLRLDGDLSWQVFPNIQIAVGEASLATPASSDAASAEIVRFTQAQLAVALKPLLQKQLVIQGVKLSGLNANLMVDKNGVGNWSKIGNQTQTAEATPSEKNSATQDLGIQKLQLDNSTVHYVNAQTGQDILLENLALSGENIQLNNTEFPLRLSSEIHFKDAQQNLAADIELNTKLQINDTLDNFMVNDGDIRLSAEHSNTQAKLSAKTRLKLTATANMKDALVWSLSNLDVQDTSLQYSAKDGTELRLKSLDLTGTLQPGGEPGLLRLQSELSYSAPKQPAINTQVTLASTLSIDSALNQINSTGTVFTTTIGDETISIKGDAKATIEPLSYQASVLLSPANFRKIANTLAISLPEMAEANSLSKVGVNATINGDDKLIAISGLNATLDTSTISGDISLPLGEGKLTKLALNIDKINVDHYLPLPAKETAPANSKGKTSAPTPSPSSDEIALPRDMLNSLNIDANIGAGELIISQLPFKNLKLKLSAKQGITQLSPVSGLVYDSPFKIAAEIDTRATAAKFQFKADSKQLPIGKVLTALEISQELSGLSDVDLNLSTSGATISGLKKNLDGNIVLAAQQLRLNNMNIERAFCQLVNRLQQETFDPNNWPLYTDLKDTTTKIVITKGIAKIEQLNAGVTKLALRGDGKVDLTSDSFDVVLNTRLAQADQDAMVCKINNEKLLNRDIPIRCKASFDSVGATSCLPDFRVIEDIAKEKAKNKVEEKAQELIDRKMGGENGEAAKQLFNQFFKK